jgi:uncharacterized short protein YbdD (DUF466 family)
LLPQKHIKESKLQIAKIQTALNHRVAGIQIEVNADYNNYLLAQQKIEIQNKSYRTSYGKFFRVEQNTRLIIQLQPII